MVRKHSTLDCHAWLFLIEYCWVIWTQKLPVWGRMEKCKDWDQTQQAEITQEFTLCLPFFPHYFCTLKYVMYSQIQSYRHYLFHTYIFFKDFLFLLSSHFLLPSPQLVTQLFLTSSFPHLPFIVTWDCIRHIFLWTFPYNCHLHNINVPFLPCRKYAWDILILSLFWNNIKDTEMIATKIFENNLSAWCHVIIKGHNL